MKKLLFFITLLLIAIIGTAQTTFRKGVDMPVGTLKIGSVAVTPTAAELNHVDGVTSAIQTQLNDKVNVGDSVVGYTGAEVDLLINSALRLKFENALNQLGTRVVLPLLAYGTLVSTSTMTDGCTYYNIFEIRDTITVRRFQWIMGTAGSYTADNYNGIAIMSYNPTTGAYVKIVETANDGAIWTATASTLAEKTFTPTLLQPGFYAVALLFNCSSTPTTAPSITSFGTTNSASGLLWGHLFTGGDCGETAINNRNKTDLTGIGTIHGIIIKP